MFNQFNSIVPHFFFWEEKTSTACLKGVHFPSQRWSCPFSHGAGDKAPRSTVYSLEQKVIYSEDSVKREVWDLFLGQFLNPEGPEP